MTASWPDEIGRAAHRLGKAGRIAAPYLRGGNILGDHGARGNHGMIARGPNLESAVDFAQRLEIMCRQYVLARAMGEPKRLSDPQWEEFFEKAEALSYASRA